MNTSSLSIWVLADDRPGNRNQVLGVAEALKLPYELKEIRYTALARLPNVLGASLKRINPTLSDDLAGSPDLVIACGRRSGLIARAIKKRSPKTKIVQLMWPGYPSKNFDLIFAPVHDGIRESERVITIPVAAHRVSKDLLKSEAGRWKASFSHLRSPLIGLIVGGPSGKNRFRKQDVKTLGMLSSAFANHCHGSLIISTSRRTTPAMIATLKKSIVAPAWWYIYSSGGKNPYPAILHLSKAIIVTGDSASMCAETCASGKPVYIYVPPSMHLGKFELQHRIFFEKGYAKPFNEAAINTIHPFFKPPSYPLDSASFIASEIRRRFLLPLEASSD